MDTDSADDAGDPRYDAHRDRLPCWPSALRHPPS
jgi:hypothetical protein